MNDEYINDIKNIILDSDDEDGDVYRCGCCDYDCSTLKQFLKHKNDDCISSRETLPKADKATQQSLQEVKYLHLLKFYLNLK